MQININDIFRDAFGYEPPTQTPVITQAPARVESSSLGSSFYAEDVLGREYFMPVRFQGIFPKSLGDRPFDLVVPFAVASVGCKKTIVSTPMPERGGSVKELISLDDYAINIKGILISDDNVFPEQQIIDIHNIFRINESITIRSVLTDIFLSGQFDHRVVIKELKWPVNAGIEHAKPFELDCESDMIFTLEV